MMESSLRSMFMVDKWKRRPFYRNLASWTKCFFGVLLIVTVCRLFVMEETWNWSRKESIAAKHLLGANLGERKLKMMSSTWVPSEQRQQEAGPDANLPSAGKTSPSASHLDNEMVQDRNRTEYDQAKSFLGANILYDKEVKFKDATDNIWMEQRENEYQRRMDRVRSICHKKNVSSAPPLTDLNQYLGKVRLPFIDEDPPIERPSLEHFSLVPSLQTMGCFVNKVASSSLVSAFLLVNGFGPSFSSPHSYAPYLRPRSSEDFRFSNTTFFKFMFVRHPMERLLSCYLDKMVNSPHWSLPAFRQHVAETGRYIIKRRREGLYKPRRKLLANEIQKWDAHSIHPAPMNLYKDSSMLNGQAPPSRTKNQPPTPSLPQQNTMHNQTETAKRNATQVIPTFEEFLEFVLGTDLQGRGYDSHWVPYWRYCTPCHVPYDVIGKLETAADDFKYIWRKTGLETKVPIPWVNRKPDAATTRVKSAKEAKYYSSISRELILRVYQRFQLDFQLFEYSINDVLRQAGYDPIDEERWQFSSSDLQYQ